jgi:hypothetical protein
MGCAPLATSSIAKIIATSSDVANGFLRIINRLMPTHQFSQDWLPEAALQPNRRSRMGLPLVIGGPSGSGWSQKWRHLPALGHLGNNCGHACDMQFLGMFSDPG